MAAQQKRFRHKVSGVVVVADEATTASLGPDWEADVVKPVKPAPPKKTDK